MPLHINTDVFSPMHLSLCFCPCHNRHGCLGVKSLGTYIMHMCNCICARVCMQVCSCICVKCTPCHYSSSFLCTECKLPPKYLACIPINVNASCDSQVPAYSLNGEIILLFYLLCFNFFKSLLRLLCLQKDI